MSHSFSLPDPLTGQRLTVEVAEPETCGRCGRVWLLLPDGSYADHTPHGGDLGPCGGCGGGGYVAPKPKPLSLDCPTCGRKGALTRHEAQRGYHCGSCTAAAEFGIEP